MQPKAADLENKPKLLRSAGVGEADGAAQGFVYGAAFAGGAGRNNISPS